MLKITRGAAALLSDARASSGAPEQFGVRFYLIDSPAQGKALAFDFVEFPEPRDEVAEEEGLPVYVAPELAPVVADSTLDAQQEDGRNQLVFRRPGSPEERPA
jgi:Fe-S cluster assembly iron-binding protein IscA